MHLFNTSLKHITLTSYFLLIKLKGEFLVTFYPFLSFSHYALHVLPHSIISTLEMFFNFQKLLGLGKK